MKNVQNTQIKAIKNGHTKTKKEQTDSDSKELSEYVYVHSVEDYFALPKYRRQSGIWYKKPIGLPSEFFGDEVGWEEWTRRIIKEYPIQGWLREWFWSWDNPIYSFIRLQIIRVKDLWYEIKCYFKPMHPVIRKAIPKTWLDISHLIIDVNFAMIQDFYYGEVVDGHIEWKATKGDRTFYNWLKRAVKYIEVERPVLQKKLDESYPEHSKVKSKPYKELYKDVIHYENLIKRKDTKVLTQMIEYRDYFWT